MKDEGKMILLSIQSDARKKRVKRELKRLEKKFEEKWEKIKKDQLVRNKIVMTAYIENPQNKLTIQMRMEKLRAEFLAPPTPGMQYIQPVYYPRSMLYSIIVCTSFLFARSQYCIVIFCFSISM